MPVNRDIWSRAAVNLCISIDSAFKELYNRMFVKAKKYWPLHELHKHQSHDVIMRRVKTNMLFEMGVATESNYVYCKSCLSHFWGTHGQVFTIMSCDCCPWNLWRGVYFVLTLTNIQLYSSWKALSVSIQRFTATLFHKSLFIDMSSIAQFRWPCWQR